MLSKIAVGAIAIIIAAGAGVLFGSWLQKPTLDDLVERNQLLESQDSTRKVELEDGRVAYVRLTRDYNDGEKAWAFVTDSLGNVANALRREAQKQNREIETLATANALLRVDLKAAVDNITITEEAVTAELFTYKKYEDGSIRSEGFVTIWTPEDDEPWGNASLTFDIQMSPTVLVSRDESSGLATCDISFGDMPVYMSDLRCVNNFDVDLPTREKIALPSIVLGSAITLGLVGLAVIVF